MELLSPLFEQDRLLPRTLMSVMSLEHVRCLYETKLIPMEVCLANGFYFANTEKDVKVRLVINLSEVIFSTLIRLLFRSNIATNSSKKHFYLI